MIKVGDCFMDTDDNEVVKVIQRTGDDFMVEVISESDWCRTSPETRKLGHQFSQDRFNYPRWIPYISKQNNFNSLYSKLL